VPLTIDDPSYYAVGWANLNLYSPYTTDGAANSTVVGNIKIRLGDLLIDSIFNYDKDLYFSSSLYLKLYVDQVWNIIFTIADNTGVVLTNFAQAIQLLNMNLMCYTQANPEISSLVINECQHTKELYIPYIIPNSQSFSASTNQSTTFRVVGLWNSRLYKNFYCINTGIANECIGMSSNLLITNDNTWLMTGVNVGKIHTYVNIYINSLLTYFFNTAQLEDMEYTKDNFKHNSITWVGRYGAAGGIYLNFDSEPIKEDQYKNISMKGLIMPNNEIVLMHQFTTTSTATTHWCFSVLLRTIYTKNGQWYNNAVQ